jgi:hypothetical protein
MWMRDSLLRVAMSLPLLILVASFGCRAAPPPDASLLTGDPCEPPCWQGLTPGVSTEEEVYEFVRTSELVDQTTLYIRNRTDDTGEVVGVAVHWRSRANMAGVPRQFGNSFMVRDGVVQAIMVFLDCEVTLADLLERYGEPHRWSVTWVSLEMPDLDVTLYYPDHGFAAQLTLPADDTWLRPESSVDLVRYYVVVSPADFLELGPEAGYFYAYEADSLRDWQGYGIVWF